MADSTATRVLQKSSFWISLLVHVFILLSFSLVLLNHYEPDKRPALDVTQVVPSYVMPDVPRPAMQQHVKQKHIPTAKNGLEKPVLAAAQNTPKAQAAPKPKAASAAKSEQPVHLIGDKKVDKPLIKLLGKAIGAHLVYPKIAVDFGLKGVVYVGFTVHPDGRVTGAQLVKSSRAGVLDDAAIAAINAIGTINDVGQYLAAPRFLVMGIIFG